MSNEFFSAARQEILSELNGLQEIFRACTDNYQFYEESKRVERHLHKIKGLAPMMGQEKVGEIARICDMIAKHVIDQGAAKNAYEIISSGIEIMNHLFNENVDTGFDDFKRNARQAFPHVPGF